jgi:transcription initiation factor TFIIIB Brf1 subunit/transcription initiation factor TFIIB
MLTSSSTRQNGCTKCSGQILDVGEELVCSSCGIVTPKEVMEPLSGREPKAIDYTSHSLGSYLGPIEYGYEELFAEGFSKASSSFKYLKTVSDYALEGAPLYSCAKIIERVCEKLALPKAVMAESVSIAREVIGLRKDRGEVTIASVSAFAIINACKRLGVTSSGVREVMRAHLNLGYRVKTSLLIQIAIDSPIRTRARRAEEYVGNVLVHLPKVLIRTGGMPASYTQRLYEAARVALRVVDEPSRGGHNPRGLAATAVYAAEVALAEIEGRKKLFSQREAATCSQVAEYTVREQFVDIFKPQMSSIGEVLKSKMPTSQSRGPSTGKSRLLPLSQAGSS